MYRLRKPSLTEFPQLVGIAHLDWFPSMPGRGKGQGSVGGRVGGGGKLGGGDTPGWTARQGGFLCEAVVGG
jgi:hypothetical protein